MNWEDCAKMCQQVFGVCVDWEERFFDCPECGEPIYECDWSNHDWSMCPVCENAWEDVQ